MSERGTTHTFRATWTEPDPDNPGRRRLRTASTWSWRFTFRNKTYTGGGSKDTPGGFKTRAEAREAGDRRRAEVLAGLEEDPRRTTFAALERIATTEASLLRASTQHMVKTALARLRPFLKDDLASRIGRARALEYVAHQRGQDYQDSTINMDLRVLHHAIAVAFEQGLVTGVPRFSYIRLQRRQQTLRPDELQRILSELPPWWVQFYLVADEVGWRARSELKTRKWTDVDFEGGWLHLDPGHTKSGKARVFPMTARLRQQLTEQRLWIDELQQHAGKVIPWVFARMDGSPLGDMRKAWSSACRRAGFGKLEGRTGPWSSAKVPHDIRRTVLRRWDAIGAPLAVRMAAAGHDDQATHAGYVGGDPDSLKAFAERLDADREKREGQTPKVVPLEKKG
jgi:integrase